MARPTDQHRQRLQNSVFLFRLREYGGAPHPVPGNLVAGKDGTFPLPIPPQTLTPTQAVRGGYLETARGAVADTLGVSPPQWEITGQMLLTPQTVNGVTLSGFAFQHQLEQFIAYYATQNRAQALKGGALLRLEWHDFYADQHWTVLPSVVPLGARSNNSPLTERYTLRLRGLEPVTSTVPAPDRGKAALDQNIQDAILALCPDPSHVGASA